ncbi:MAG TPA: 16S rRNA (guanine(966)-N(2))-methyltransferase RsmD [Flavobacteriales bacterium]|nr:16S rRNA (guanine(966)-N(2))-methyltransferase RsmD [Flavobacteriales bacterium]HRE98618.1 16S rRNA (guanine(966)-N(2))-methyltransferase RsmD [Flavobacteriales bacterium]HRJ37857.1 16S rRNA (guanine(966)-N(2))-methyltransferase RsmD [Flavobacteriales bacterium]
MRIIGGKFKGRKLQAPLLPDTRPTTDFARESLFNLLQTRFDLDGIKVLDLFAGTGAVSFEFISRGAAMATCVDTSPKALQFIRDAAKQLGIEIRTNRSEVERFLKSDSSSYDIIFADPPYTMADLSWIPKMVFEKNLLREGGLLIIEHSRDTDLSMSPGFLEHKHYGKVNFTFFS